MGGHGASSVRGRAISIFNTYSSAELDSILLFCFSKKSAIRGPVVHISRVVSLKDEMSDPSCIKRMQFYAMLSNACEFLGPHLLLNSSFNY